MQETEEAKVLSLGQEAESSPEGGRGNPLQYSSLENPMDRGAWRATVPQDHKESDMTEGTEQARRHIAMHTPLSQ